MKRTLDHLVYCTADLDHTVEYISDHLGVAPVFGGYHRHKGTKNALLRLNEKTYFEILAIDRDNSNVGPPRWMGIDYIETAALSRWAFKSVDLRADLSLLLRHHLPCGPISQGSRSTGDGRTLSWQLIEPLPYPRVDTVPFFLDWSESVVHPCEMIQPTCHLSDLLVYDPNATALGQAFDKLGIDVPIKEASTRRLEVTLEGPLGSLTLS